MMSTPKSHEDARKCEVDVYLLEYETLKQEQIARIGFRDNLLYVALTATGAIGAFSLTESDHIAALLLIPWATVILGWAYLVNDEKISALGRYIRLTLDERILTCVRGEPADETTASRPAFGWEVAHRSDSRRKRRKWEQLLNDQLTFVGSGLAAIVIYWLETPALPYWALPVILVESACLLLLCFEIRSYADTKVGR